jgi:hypothetical protein
MADLYLVLLRAGGCTLTSSVPLPRNSKQSKPAGGGRKMLSDPSLSSPSSPSTSKREKDNNYHRVVSPLNERYRLVECKDGIQWLVQRRDKSSETLATTRWRNVSYPRCREGVFAALAWLRIEVSPAVMARLVALPDWLHKAHADYIQNLPGVVS